VRIGELAAATGASVRSLRYYEEHELLASERTSGGQRRYAAEAVDRVRLVQLLIAAGVPSKHIVEILPCAYSDTTTPAMVEVLLAERARIDASVRELTATRERLDDIITDVRGRLAH
jgi:DNA-binding transcriptional MerR regulator